jgi:excisionase family DNA binding protein
LSWIISKDNRSIWGSVMNSQPERWLSVEGIADHLGVSKETIYRWLERGRIPAHRIGRLWKFKPTEVDAWIVKGDAAEIVGPKDGSNMEWSK